MTTTCAVGGETMADSFISIVILCPNHGPEHVCPNHAPLLYAQSSAKHSWASEIGLN